MKKRKDSPSAIYLRNHPYVSLSILILIVIFFVWAFSVKHFDQEKDVCTLSCSKYCIKNGCCNCVDQPCYKKGELDISGIVCAEWRPKTKCELNPNSEGCICDEYDRYAVLTLTTPNTSGLNMDIEYYHPYDCNASLERISDTEWNIFCISGKCIKSHEPDECEKGNSNYVLDLNMPCVCRDDVSTRDRVLVGSNETELCKKVDCSMNCRKKTIQDFSCSELKKAVVLNKRFVVCDTAVYKVYFTSEKFIMGCWTTWISTEVIYDVAVSKGCDI